MSDIGFYHPLIVHFVIALATVGVLLRWISFTGTAAFTGPAAVALLLLGTSAESREPVPRREMHGTARRRARTVRPSF